MVTRKRALIVSLLAVVVLLLAACAPDTTTSNDAEVAASSHDEAEAAGSHEDAEAADGHEDAEAEHSHDEEAADHHEDEEAASSHAGEADGGHGHGGAAEALDGAKEIRVVATEFAFEPASLHLHEGEAVNIVFVNEGTVEHEIELEAFDFHAHAEPGEMVTAGFVPDKSGSFEFGCFVPGHYDAGMSGQLVVEPAHS